MSKRSGEALASLAERLLKIGFGVGGLVSFANGIWMIVAPGNWVDVFPGQIPDFGPFNKHFVRDLGGWYVAGGVLMLLALTNPIRLGGAALAVTFIAYLVHAGSHIADTITGVVGGEHWIVDFPFIYGPVILLGLMIWIWWTLQSERHTSRLEEERTEEEVAEVPPPGAGPRPLSEVPEENQPARRLP